MSERNLSDERKMYFTRMLEQTQREYMARNNGKRDPFCEKYIRMVRQGINPLPLIVSDAQSEGKNPLVIDAAIKKAKRVGDWWENAENATQALERIREIYKHRKYSTAKENTFEIIEETLDKRRDADLIAHALFIDPEIREMFKGEIENLYRVILSYERTRDPSYTPERELKHNTKDASHPTSRKDAIFSKGLELFIGSLPEEVFTKDDEHYTGLRRLIKKKANREAITYFKKSPALGLAFLERCIAKARNEGVKWVYQNVLNTYQQYAAFQFIGENKKFTDPVSGQTGSFPSLHQRIGVHHALDRQRFGILDGCGTGKTAIGALMYPLIKQKKQAECKKAHNRVLVVGTIPCLKTWRKGMEGSDTERYLADKKAVAVVNGHKKDDTLFQELKKAEVVFANYQQLSANFKRKGENVPVYKVLAELGYDLIVFDEVHNIKNRNETTAKGKETHSAAARYLAFRDKDAYFLLLSGTPMPDNLRDYGMIYHLLQPTKCKDPDEFVRAIEEMSYDPHTLSTFVDENTLRRTAEEVNDLPELDREHWYEDLKLSSVQRVIHDYLTSHRPLGWIMETRKCLVDPRLVDPLILKRLNLLGKITTNDSAKYSRLEQLVTEQGGPLAKGEKFVVFSSTLKEGITRVAEKIATAYTKQGLKECTPSLHLEQTIQQQLEQAIKSKYGSNKYLGVIDGNVSLLEREKLVTRFKQDPNLVGLICTTDTGGESLDFSHATHGYFLDEDFSPASIDQPVARIQRRGQSKPVTIKFLRGIDTFDQIVSEYVQKKALAITIALDGHPPTPEEISLLTSDTNTKLGEMVSKRFGGISIDTSKYQEFDVNDIVVKTSHPPTVGIEREAPSNGLETTKAQEIAKRIAVDPRCWFDPAFAKDYAENLHALAPHFLNRVRVLDLLGRAKRKEIDFPKNVLVTAAGPSIMWQAYQDLGTLIEREGFPAPDVHDLDYSHEMLHYGKNPFKIIADMRELPVQTNSYDLVDHGSLPLLNGPEEVRQALIEANRALKADGLLEMSVKGLYFMKGFHDALEQLGFKPLTKKHSCFSLSGSARKKLAAKHGFGFAETFKGKLENSHFILAQKTGEPSLVKQPEHLWFLTELGRPYEQMKKPFEEEKLETGSRNKGRRGRWEQPKRQEKGQIYNKPYIQNKDGTVDPL